MIKDVSFITSKLNSSDELSSVGDTVAGSVVTDVFETALSDAFDTVLVSCRQISNC